MGKIIPVFCDLFLPGDMLKISAEAFVRANPLIAPIMHRVDLKADYFAVPICLLWPKPDYKDDDGVSLGYTKDISSFEEFITGGGDRQAYSGPTQMEPDCNRPLFPLGLLRQSVKRYSRWHTPQRLAEAFLPIGLQRVFQSP
jgi:hypothetical protein